MTTYRYRVKFDPDPRSLWRDIVVGADQTLNEFQSVLNRSVGLNQDHLWYFGTGQDYRDSNVKYKCPREMEESAGGLMRGGSVYNAGETTVGQIADPLDLEERDRICYLFDYGDEWRFYAILKEINKDGESNKYPDVVKKKGEPVEQYPQPGESW